MPWCLMKHQNPKWIFISLHVDQTTDCKLLAVRLLPEKTNAMVPQALGMKGAGLQDALQTLHRVCYTDKLGNSQQVTTPGRKP